MFHTLPKPISNAGVTAKTTVKATQCMVHGLVVVNQTAAEAFLQVFDALLANVTLGVTVPDYFVPIPASGGVVIPLSNAGFQHFIGVVIGCTTGASNGVGAACDVTMFIK